MTTLMAILDSLTPSPSTSTLANHRLFYCPWLTPKPNSNFKCLFQAKYSSKYVNLRQFKTATNAYDPCILTRPPTQSVQPYPLKVE